MHFIVQVHCVLERERNQFELREARMSLVAWQSAAESGSGGCSSGGAVSGVGADVARRISAEPVFGDDDFSGELVRDAGRPGTDRS